jgi:hypothetical protein
MQIQDGLFDALIIVEWVIHERPPSLSQGGSTFAWVGGTSQRRYLAGEVPVEYL